MYLFLRIRRQVLRGISLIASPGNDCVVGATGAGKSTLWPPAALYDFRPAAATF